MNDLSHRRGLSLQENPTYSEIYQGPIPFPILSELVPCTAGSWHRSSPTPALLPGSRDSTSLRRVGRESHVFRILLVVLPLRRVPMARLKGTISSSKSPIRTSTGKLVLLVLMDTFVSVSEVHLESSVVFMLILPRTATLLREQTALELQFFQSNARPSVKYNVMHVLQTYVL
ncbi:hypothetical protein M404DRAFT_555402 [Pisolithus tinctorius Marx 270]|uniref:Uncharacterized protein n=1 Tax=Pisolithus tinctorius Marx 270 TaxID=870435 RepID=A0A0C3J5V9_PISTI|nr:hypothetical protein M404DRAFT_555402 [Pisolithus tinctorius Marx 270]